MLNRVILMGRLCGDPELKTTPSGVSVTSFRIAIDRSYVAAGKERQADFIDVVAWRQTADFVGKYFSKGRMILIEGSIQNSNYTDQNGVKHYATAIMAERVQFCGDKSGAQGQPDYRPSQASVPQRSVAPAQAPQPVELGDLGEFEEILSDGEVPF